MSKSILILGAAGSVGYASSKKIVERGYRVRALIPPWEFEERRRLLERLNVEILQGCIQVAADLKRAMQGMDVVINAAAAMPHLLDKKIQFETNVEGTRQVLLGAAQMNIEQVIFISTAGVASHHNQEAVSDEGAPYRQPQNDHVWSKIEAEKCIDELSVHLNVKSVVLRPVSVYGLGAGFRWPEIFQMVKNGKMVLVNKGVCPYPLIHLEDLADAVLLAIEKQNQFSKTEKFILSSGEPLTLGSIVNTVADFYKVPRPKSYPFFLVYAGSWALKLLPDFLKNDRLRLVRPGTAVEYKVGHRYNIDKAKNVLGFQAKVPFQKGLTEMLQNYEGIHHRN